MSNELTHYGVLGMKWGVRKDGMPQGYQGTPRYTKRADKIYNRELANNDRINNKFQKKTDAREQAYKKNKSDKNLKRLNEAKYRQEVIAKRNQRLAELNYKYNNQKFTDRFKDPKHLKSLFYGKSTWDQNYIQATSEVRNALAKKYSEETIKAVESSDLAKSIGAAAVLSVLAIASAELRNL